MNKILQKSSILVSLIFAFYGIAKSQENSLSALEIANEHIRFINQLTSSLRESQKCIYYLYSDLEPSRDSKRDNFIGSGYICGRSSDEGQLTVLQDKTKNHLLSNSQMLIANAQELYDIFVKINQLCRELEIYVRLKDYNKDHLKRSDEIYNQLVLNFDKFKQQKEKYYSFISGNYQIRGQSSVFMVYSKLKEYLDGEEKLANDFRINLCVNTYTSNLPVEELLEQIKLSDNVLAKIQIPQTQEMYYARNFMDGAKNHLQKTKSSAIDAYSDEARKSDEYSNNCMDNYSIYLNDYLISDFNRFVENSNDELLLYPQSLIAFKIDSVKKEYIQKIVEYKALETPLLKIEKKNITLTKKSADALNNYVDFINEELRINYDFATHLYYLNQQANKQLEASNKELYLSFSYYDGYALPNAAYEKALNESQYIDKVAADILNLLLKELYDMIKEKYQLEQKLDLYVNSKKYKQDRHSELYKILERFEYLLNMFDSKKQVLYDYCRQIADSYQPVASSPWTIGNLQMNRQLMANLQALNQIRKECVSEQAKQVNSASVSEISRDLLIHEYDNLKGLKKIGEYHGHCPYNPYEDIAENSANFADIITKFPNQERIKNDLANYYRDFVYQYNNQVEYDNKFVELAAGGYETFATHKIKEVYLLKNVKQQVFFKFEKPNVVDKPVDDPNKEPAGIKTNKGNPAISMDGFAINNLVLLLDISGSMKAEDKLPLLRASFLEILPYLRAEDEISIVAFSNNGALLLKPISCSEKEKITEIFKKLESEGMSNFDKGIKLAYKTARSNFKTGANNRIIIATDGAFSISDELYQLAETESDNDIYLSIFSFGNKENKVRSLDKLADKGKGNYEYIGTNNAVEKLLKEFQALKIK